MTTTLDNAMKAFIAHKFDRSDMDVLAWSRTYNVEPDQVRKSWEKHMTVASRQPQDSYGEFDGK